MSAMISFTLNGVETQITAEPATPLIFALRNDLGVVSPRLGCGEEQCGACRVMVDDNQVYSCTFTLGEAAGRHVRTIEGLLEDDRMQRLQAAFLAENAGQCGYCLSGIVMSGWLLLQHHSSPTREEIQHALKDHLCRCGAHNRMIRAIEKAAQEPAHG